jgi:hypothetical protein
MRNQGDEVKRGDKELVNEPPAMQLFQVYTEEKTILLIRSLRDSAIYGMVGIRGYERVGGL